MSDTTKDDSSTAVGKIELLSHFLEKENEIVNTTLKNIFSSKYSFAAFFSLLLFVHIVCTFCGFYGNDDAIYARYAALFEQTGRLNSNITDHYNLRWVCIAATSFFYKLFGINAISSSLFSFSCFVVTAFVVNKLIEKEKPSIRFFANLLFFFNYSVIFYAHRLLPDAGVCLFIFLAYFFYQRQRFSIAKQNFSNAILFALSLFVCALTKETVFITLPLWVYFFLADVLKKRNTRFWFTAIVFFFILVFFYALYFKMETGDWLYRYHLLLQVNANYGDGIGYNSFGDVLDRISYTLWQSFLLNGDFEYLLPAIVTLCYLQKIIANEQTRLLAMSFCILLLSADLMTFSPVTYAPLLPDPRHFLFLVPFAVILAAHMLHAYFREPKKYILLPLFFGIVTIIIFFLPIGNTKYIYLLITLILILRLLSAAIAQVNFSVNYYVVFLFVVLAANFLYDFLQPQYPFYADQQKIVQQHFAGASNGTVVFTGDPQTARMGDYFLQFNNAAVKFQLLNDTTIAQFLPGNSYLLVDGGYNEQFRKKTDSVLQQMNYFSAVKLVAKQNNTELYKIEKPDLLNQLKAFSTNQYW